MADTAVAITAGTGTNIDTRTEGTNSNHRQVIVIGDPATNAGVAPVDVTAGLKVDLGADNDVTITSGTVDLGATDNAVLDSIDTATTATQAAVETIDNAISGTEMQVDVVAALPAGTNAIGKLAANTGVDIGDVDVTSLSASVDGAGAPTIDSYTTAAVNLATGANGVVVAAPGASKQIWVYGLVGTVDVDGSISIQDADDTALSGIMPVAANGGFVMNPSGNFAMPWIKVATNKALEIDAVTCTFDGTVTYAIVSV